MVQRDQWGTYWGPKKIFFLEAGVAPPTHPRRPRVVRFNSVVDDSDPVTPPLGS